MPVTPDSAALIDLDHDGGELEPYRPWRLTVRGAVPGRFWPAAVLGVALLLSLSGGAAPSPGLVRLWTVPLAEPGPPVMRIDEERLFQIEPGDDGPELAAYRLADGYALWRTRLTPAPGAGSVHRLLASQAEAVIVGRRAGTDGRGAIFGYDPVTGHQRWELLGWSEVMDVGENHLLLSRVPERVSGQEWSFQPPRDLLLLDRVSGQPVATAGLGSDALAVLVESEAGPQLVRLGADGRLQRIDLATGGVLAASQVAPEAEPPAWFVGKGQLIVVRTGAQSGAVGYDLETLQLRWEAADAVAVRECGHWWCVDHHSDVAARVEVIDPDSGERRWTQGCDPRPETGTCQIRSVEQTADRIWLHQTWIPSGDASPPEPAAMLLDASTGAEVARLGRWRLAEQDTSPRRWAYQVAASAPGRSVNDADDPVGAPTRFWLGHLGADLQVRLVGEFEAAVWGLTGEYLVAVVDDRIEVWHVR